MGATIVTLKAQHAELRVCIGHIAECVTVGDVSRVAEALNGLGKVLRVHLALEDDRVYAQMGRATAGMKQTVQLTTADTYRRNMEVVSKALVAFLDRYSGAFDLAEFERDWPLVSKMLLDRMESEESTLYPMYEAWCSDTQE